MKRLLIPIILLTFTLFIGCADDDPTAPTPSQLTLDITDLGNLGAGYQYEGWIMVDGSPVSTGTFTVDDNGNLSQTEFEVNEDNLNSATAFILTIEPNPDDDPAPSDVHVIAGDFGNGVANLSVSHNAAFGSDFMNVSGEYILATPTNGEGTNENSGIWFLNPSSGTPVAGLELPNLPNGWTYEGWAVINGTPVTTGTFTDVSAADNSAPYSGTQAGPPFPGEDFLNNAPAGLTFPTDLSGGMAVISVEPVPDNSAAPFFIKPLLGSIPTDATDHTPYNMNQNLGALPVGTAMR